MSLSSQVVKNVFVGNGVTREFTYTIVTDPNLLKLYLVRDTQEIPITANYQIDHVNKKVIYPTPQSGLPPLSSSEKLVVIRETPITQETDFTTQINIDRAALEGAFDKLTMIAQELKEKIDRTVMSLISEYNKPKKYEEMMQTFESLKNQTESMKQQVELYLQICANLKSQCEIYANICQNSYNSIVDQSGTLAERPQAPGSDMFYWATDVEQYYRYSTKAGKWFLIG